MANDNIINFNHYTQIVLFVQRKIVPVILVRHIFGRSAHASSAQAQCN